MARIRYIPHDQDREDQKAEEKAERRAMRKAPVDSSAPEGPARFGGLDPQDEEFASIEAFAEFLTDNDREEYTHVELACLNFRTGMVVAMIKQELEAFGFRFKLRAKERRVRGFSANPHDRWSAYPSHGGGGGGSIMGMAD